MTSVNNVNQDSVLLAVIQEHCTGWRQEKKDFFSHSTTPM